MPIRFITALAALLAFSTPAAAWWEYGHETVGRIFVKHLNRAGFDLARVRLIESLLFLSMIPLHKDHPERQVAMALRGLSLFQEFGVQA